MRHLSDLDKVA